jgi:hypothetical protein
MFQRWMLFGLRTARYMFLDSHKTARRLIAVVGSFTKASVESLQLHAGVK